MRYQAVIFDLDGVICHTDEYHYLAWKQVADELKIRYTREINDKMRGVDRMASLEILLQASDKELTDEMKDYYANKKNAIYRELLDELTPQNLEPEVIETLQWLRGLGVKLAIGSSSKNTLLILSKLGLDHFFDAISDGTSASHAKPDPEIFINAAKLMGVEAGDCLVVEDAMAGLDAAKAAGMDSAAIGAAVKLGLSNYVIDNLTDLRKIVNS